MRSPVLNLPPNLPLTLGRHAEEGGGAVAGSVTLALQDAGPFLSRQQVEMMVVPEQNLPPAKRKFIILNTGKSPIVITSSDPKATVHTILLPGTDDRMDVGSSDAFKFIAEPGTVSLLLPNSQKETETGKPDTAIEVNFSKSSIYPDGVKLTITPPSAEVYTRYVTAIKRPEARVIK